MSKRRRAKWATLSNVGLAALAVATLGMVGAVALTPDPAPPVSAKVTEFYAEHTTPPTRAPLPEALFIGDSYTYGSGGSGIRWTQMTAQRFGWLEKNWGRGGTGYLSASDRSRCHLDYCPAYPEAIAAYTDPAPAIVVVAGGRNDSLQDRPRWEAAVTATYQGIRTKFPDARIFAVSPIAEGPAAVDGKGEFVRMAVEAVGGAYVDVGQPLFDKPNLLSADRVHPNADGYRVITEAFAAACGERCEPGVAAPAHTGTS